MLEIHSVLLDSVHGKNKRRGEFRRLQNWIGKPGCSLEEATFVPPDYFHLNEGLDNLEKYIHYDEEDRLVQLALIHGQFEILHPFLDGNGRVGRILIPLFLYEKKLIGSPVFYISKYLEKNRDEYCNRLFNITDKGDWEGWIEFFLKAVISQSIDNSEKARAIIDLYEQKKKKISEITQSRFSIQAIDTLFKKPLFSSADFRELSGISRKNSLRILNKLVENDVVEVVMESKGRLPAIMVFSKLMDIVEE